MKKVLTILLIATLLRLPAADLPLVNGDRIGILGHSLTLAPTGLWSDYEAVYLIGQHPDLFLQFCNLSRSGMGIEGCFSNAQTGYQVYPGQMYAFQPTYVFFMFGGAGGYSDPAVYSSNEVFLIDNYIAGLSGAKAVITGMTPEPDLSGFSGGNVFEAGDALTSAHYTPNVPYSTIWSTLRPQFTNAANYPALSFDFASGNVHPSKAGNIAVAWQDMKQKGWDTNVSSATIDAATATVSATNHCVVSGVTGNTHSISFTRHDDRLLWAIDEAGRFDATNIWPQMIGWQNYSLQVSNLATGTYSIAIDGVVVDTATSAQLAAGKNLADMTAGPIHDQAQAVLTAIRVLQDLDPVGLTNINTPKGVQQLRGAANTAYQDNDKSGAALLADAGVIAALNSVSNLSWSAHAAAQQTNHTFSITLIQPRYLAGHR